MAISPETNLMLRNASKQLASGIGSPIWTCNAKEYTSPSPLKQSIKFDTTAGASIHYAFTSAQGMGSGGMGCWVKVNSFTNGRRIIGINGGSNVIHLYTHASKLWYASGNSGVTNSISEYAKNQNPYGEWVLVMFEWSANGTVQRTNGVEDLVYDYDDDRTRTDPSSGSLVIGNYYSTANASTTIDGNIAQAFFWKGTISDTLAAKIYNNSIGILYSDLTTAEKTEADFVAWYDLEDDSDITFIDSHAGKTATAVGTITRESGVTSRLQQTETISVSGSGLLSSGAKSGKAEITARTNSVWETVQTQYQENSDGTLELISNVFSWNVSYARGRITGAGDSVEMEAGVLNIYALFQLIGDDGSYILFYSDGLREYPGGVLSGTKPLECMFPYKYKVKVVLLSSNEFELYINGKLATTTTLMSAHTATEWKLGIYSTSHSPIGEKWQPPIFKGPTITGLPSNEYEEATVCVVENENDLIGGQIILDVGAESDPESDGSDIPKLVNENGSDGEIISGRDATKRFNKDRLKAIEFNKDGHYNFGRLFDHYGEASLFIAFQNDVPNTTSNCMFDQTNSLQPYAPSHPWANQLLYENFGLKSATVPNSSVSAIDMSQRRLYSILAQSYNWKVSLDKTEVLSRTTERIEFNQDFIFGGNTAFAVSYQYDGFLFRMVSLSRIPNASELLQIEKSLGWDSHLEYSRPLCLFTIPSSKVGVPVAITNLSTFADSYEIDWDDGSVLSTDIGATHTYSAPGTYQVEVTAINDTLGTSDTYSVSVEITDLELGVIVTPGEPRTAPLAVTFTDDSDITPTEATWYFGDGGKSTAISPKHYYLAPGTYTVKQIGVMNGRTFSNTFDITLVGSPTVPTGNAVAFDEIELDRCYSEGAIGGPVFKTEGFGSDYGVKQTNSDNLDAIHEFQLNFEGTNEEQLEELLNHFLPGHGAAIGFRFFPPYDNQFKDEEIATVTNGVGEYDLIKTYSRAGRDYVRRIIKPIPDLSFQLDGIDVSDSAYTVDYVQGKITFNTPGTLITGQPLTVNGFHHIPVLFKKDKFRARQFNSFADLEGLEVQELLPIALGIV